jgi:hypothetical protein
VTINASPRSVAISLPLRFATRTALPEAVIVVRSDWVSRSASTDDPPCPVA